MKLVKLSAAGLALGLVASTAFAQHITGNTGGTVGGVNGANNYCSASEPATMHAFSASISSITATFNWSVGSPVTINASKSTTPTNLVQLCRNGKLVSSIKVAYGNNSVTFQQSDIIYFLAANDHNKFQLAVVNSGNVNTIMKGKQLYSDSHGAYYVGGQAQW